MSSIEWTDATWNPTGGCSRLSAGCDNCYAIKMANRFKNKRDIYDGTVAVNEKGEIDWSGVVNFEPKVLTKPHSVKSPTIFFVNSMSDLFHETMDKENIRKVFKVMNETPQHTYQVLTKRPKRAADMAAELDWTPNIWMGTSVELDKFQNRVDMLKRIPAAVKFISAEPLLGDISKLDISGIDWLIAGGESGNSRTKIRPMKLEWARSARDLCKKSEVPFFFKQWGNWSAEGVWAKSKAENGHLLDGVEHHEMPVLVQQSMLQREGDVLDALKTGPLSQDDLRHKIGRINDKDLSRCLSVMRIKGSVVQRTDARWGLLYRVKADAASR